MSDAQKSHGSHEPSNPGVESDSIGVLSDDQTTSGMLPDDQTTSSCRTSPDSTVVDPSVTSCVRDAISALSRPAERDPQQRFVSPNVESARTFERSKQFWSLVAPAKHALVERVRVDLAVDDSSVEMLLGLIDAYCEVRIFRLSMFERLVAVGGPISTRGKTRALFTSYCAALDRETKLAQVLGLERKAKPINPLDAVRQAVVEANQRQQPEEK